MKTVIFKIFIRPLCRLLLSAKGLEKNKINDIWKSANTCCVVANSGIGDAIMATPLIMAIKKRRPDIRLILIASTTTQFIFKNHFEIDSLLVYNHHNIPSFTKLIFKLRKMNIDVLLVAQPSNVISCALIAALGHAKLCLKHYKEYGIEQYRNFDFVYHELLPDDMHRHRVELNLDLLRFLGETIKPNAIFPCFTVSETAQSKIAELLLNSNISKNQQIITMHPGSGRKDKQWAPENFAQLARQLIDSNYCIVFVGGKEENGLCKKICSDIHSYRAINVAGALNLEETAALLQSSQMLISNDSGIMHLATAVNTPVTALFGHTEPKHIGPFSKNLKSKTIKKSNKVSDIKVDDVIKIIR